MKVFKLIVFFIFLFIMMGCNNSSEDNKEIEKHDKFLYEVDYKICDKEIYDTLNREKILYEVTDFNNSLSDQELRGILTITNLTLKFDGNLANNNSDIFTIIIEYEGIDVKINDANTSFTSETNNRIVLDFSLSSQTNIIKELTLNTIYLSSGYFKITYKDETIFNITTKFDDFMYKTINSNELEIMKYIGDGKGIVIIPDSVGRFNVTSIGENAFNGANIDKLILTDNLNNVALDAFKNATIKETNAFQASTSGDNTFYYLGTSSNDYFLLYGAQILKQGIENSYLIHDDCKFCYYNPFTKIDYFKYFYVPVNGMLTDFLPEKMDYLGYTFKAFKEYSINGKYVIEATYELIEYSVIYNLDGGLYENGIYTFNCVDVVDLGIPTKEGYNFVKWINQAGDEVKYLGGSYCTYTNMYLKAIYKPIKVTITFDPLGGSLADEIIEAEYGKTYNIPTPVYLDHQFIKWTGNYRDEIIYLESGSFVSHYLEDVYFTASYSDIYYTVTLELDGGTIKDDITQYRYKQSDESFTISSPEKVGYTFIGWNIVGDNNIEETFTVNPLERKSYTIKANYKINSYKLIYHFNALEMDDVTLSYDYETSVTLLEPTRKGFLLDAWYSDSEFNNKVHSLVITENIELYAKWKQTKTLEYDLEEKTATLGYYPQELEDDSEMILYLNSLVKLPTNESFNGWTAYSFYKEGVEKSSLEDAFMYYIDIDLDNDLKADYRGVYFTSYRPYYTTIDNDSDQSYNGYDPFNIFWFIYEEISWDIIEVKDGKALIITSEILDANEYYHTLLERTNATDYQDNSGTNVSPNNYQYSSIREWLNVTFYSQAFNEYDQKVILTSVVDNSIASTGYQTNIYAGPNTYDKLFLLSEKELKENFETTDLIFETTDYAQAMGAYTTSDGYGVYWLRSPINSDGNYVMAIKYNGNLIASSAYDANYGVLTACWISIE